MSSRKVFIAMMFSSLFGGIIALGGYLMLVPPANQPGINPVSNSPVSLTNYVFDTTDMIVPEGLNFVYAAKSSTPAVVHIRTTYSGAGGGYAQNPIEDFFRDFYGDRYQQRERPKGRGAGSGVILSDDGYIVTNNHVVENSEEIEVVLNDNRTYQAKVIGTDPDTDLALIKIEESGLPTITFGESEDIQIGEWVLAIGNPYEFRSTVTAGIVSAKARQIDILNRRSNTRIESFIQTDAAVNPGNSGGALVNLKGELVGINTAIASPTGSFAGYSFAVPTTLVRKVVSDLKDYGTVQRPLLGISINDVNAKLAEEKGLDVLKGVYVAAVGSGTAAEEAGIESGDVIIGVNGKKVASVSQLQEQVALNRPGDGIEVTFIREGETKTVRAVLKNEFKTTDIVKADEGAEVEGAVIIPVSDKLKAQLDISGGVQIKELNNGKWKEAGIKEGFIITRIDKRDINSFDDLAASLKASRGEGILIEGIYPNGDKAYYGLGW